MAQAVYEEARANAPFHLEVSIAAMTAGAEAIDQCRVDAVVVDVLRDDSGMLVTGDRVAFTVDCLRTDADPNEIPDCVFFEQVEELVPGALIDVYLEAAGAGYAVVRGQVNVIEAAEPPGES